VVRDRTDNYDDIDGPPAWFVIPDAEEVTP
jgi:hypothetical protein